MLKRTSIAAFLQLDLGRLIYILAIIVVSFTEALSQPKGDQDAILLKLDPEVRYGKLNNGFTYYIRHNDSDSTAFMNLIVRAGFEQEEEDQYELAHVLEHMAFKGTVRFPDPKLYLMSKGLRSGNDFNAHTGAKVTDYYIDVPAGKPGLVKEVIQLFRDWAQGGMLLNEERVDAERTVILSEINGRNAVSARMFKEYLSQMIEPERAAIRLAFDTRENVKKFNQRSLTRFYRDWYRPDREAIVVVGDIDVEAMEAQIKSQFSDLKTAKTLEKEKPEEASLFAENKFITVTNPEATGVEFKMYLKIPSLRLATRGDFKSLMIGELYNAMMQRRLLILKDGSKDLSMQPFSRFDRSLSGYGAPVSVLSAGVKADSGVAGEAIRRIMVELERVYRYGFTADEVEDAKDQYLKETHSKIYYSSRAMANDYASHFTEGNAAPGLTTRLAMFKDLSEKTTVAEVNEKIKTWIGTDHRDIVVIGPEGSEFFDKTNIFSLLSDVKRSAVEPFVAKKEEVLSQPLLTEKQQAEIESSNHKIIKYEFYDSVGVTRLVLQNGVNVLLKPTANASERILFTAGRKRENPADANAALISSLMPVIKKSGLGPYSEDELEKYFKQNNFLVYPMIGEDRVSLAGSTDPGKVESLLQAVYLYLTTVGIGQQHVDQYSEEQKKINTNFSGDNTFYDTIKYYTSHDRTREQEIDGASGSVNLRAVRQAYHQEFCCLQDFTFVFVGNFKTDSLLHVVTKYLGALPAAPSPSGIRKSKKAYTQPDHVKVRIYRDGAGEARVQLLFNERYTFSITNKLIVEMLGSALGNVIMKRLRVKEGLTYSPGVHTKCLDAYGGVCYFVVNFTCASQNVDRAISCAWEEINQLKEEGISEDIFEAAKKAVKDKLSSNITKDRFWIEYLMDQSLRSESVSAQAGYFQTLDKISPDDLKAAARQYLVDKNYMEFVEMPRDKKLK